MLLVMCVMNYTYRNIAHSNHDTYPNQTIASSYLLLSLHRQLIRSLARTLGKISRTQHSLNG